MFLFSTLFSLFFMCAIYKSFFIFCICLQYDEKAWFFIQIFYRDLFKMTIKMNGK